MYINKIKISKATVKELLIMGKPLGFKESFTEGSILTVLDKRQKRQWNELDVEEKRYFINLYKEKYKDNPQLLISDLEQLFNEKGTTGEPKSPEQIQNEKLEKFFKTQGIYNPSQTTMEAFKHQQIFANFDNFYHAIGQFTFNMEKQAQYNYYMSQQKQNFIQVAQNDKIIKQNDEIIQLLKIIAEK